MSRRLSNLRVKWNPVKKQHELILMEEHVLKEIVDRLWLQAKIRIVRINQPVAGKVHPNENGISELIGEIPSRRFEVMCSREGCGSMTVVIPPTPLYIEVKRPGGARRIAQIQFIEEKRQAGCAAFFAESWHDVVRELYPFGLRLKD